MADAAKLPVPKDADLVFKPRSEWKFVGQERGIYDLKDITTGKAPFGLDTFREGMVYASIEHPPVVRGTVKSLDDSGALAVKGVRQVVRLRSAEGAGEFPAARRRGGDRRQHVGGVQGAQGAQDRVERRAERVVRVRRVSRNS